MRTKDVQAVVDMLKDEIASAEDQTDPKSTKKEREEAFAEAFNSYPKAEDGLHAVAAIISKSITKDEPIAELPEGVLIPNDPHGMYGLLDMPQYERENEPMAFWMVETEDGIQIKDQRLHKEAFQPVFTQIWSKVKGNVDYLRAGRYSDLLTQARKAMKHLNAGILSLQFRSVQNSIDSGDDNYGAVSGGSLTKSGLETALDYVADRSDAKLIVGRRAEFTPMRDFGYTSTANKDILPESMKEFFWNSNGIPPSYHGVPILGLKRKKMNVAPGYIDDDNKKYITMDKGVRGYAVWPDNEILILCNEDFGYFCERGPLATLSGINEDRQAYITFGREIGLCIWDKHLNYRIVITA